MGTAVNFERLRILNLSVSSYEAKVSTMSGLGRGALYIYIESLVLICGYCLVCETFIQRIGDFWL